MTTYGGPGRPAAGDTPPLPTSIWVVAWTSLADQVLQLLARGVRTDNELSTVVSVLLGTLIVGYVSAGVICARTVRLVLAFVVLGLSVVFGLVSLFRTDDVRELVVSLLSLGLGAATLAALVAFRRTPWYAWQRTKPPSRAGASIQGLIGIAALVGVLGGLVGPLETEVDYRIELAPR